MSDNQSSTRNDANANVSENAAAKEQKVLRWGIIGGGLMGREFASALGRWFALDEFPVRAELVGVCDLNDKSREWFRNVPTVKLFTADHKELLQSDEIDAVYVAVPHQLHRDLYLDVIRAGKDLLAEKPFGIDLEAAQTVRDEAAKLGRFVRVSSEFPFMPGAQRVWSALSNGESSTRFAALGHVLEVRSGFQHSSDLDATKPVNWKRQVKSCGAAGVMNDLGMHVVHLPFRLGLKPKNVYAQLQKVYNERPDGHGGMAVCDTWDNAMLHCDVEIGGETVPMRLETKRLAPGETNTWFIEIMGTDGGFRYSTKEPKTLWSFERNGGEQSWKRTDLGHKMAFPTVTGGIFEAGFPDIILQMLAAFVAEREGFLDARFGCVTPDEAVQSHRLWQAALQSHEMRRAIEL